MINYKDAETALQYLVNTDEDYARSKTLYDALCEQKKTVLASQYVNLSGSAAEKTKLAEASEVYKNHLLAIKDAQIEFEVMRATRLTKEKIIDMWRSVNSAQKMGNV